MDTGARARVRVRPTYAIAPTSANSACFVETSAITSAKVLPALLSSGPGHRIQKMVQGRKKRGPLPPRVAVPYEKTKSRTKCALLLAVNNIDILLVWMGCIVVCLATPRVLRQSAGFVWWGSAGLAWPGSVRVPLVKSRSPCRGPSWRPRPSSAARPAASAPAAPCRGRGPGEVSLRCRRDLGGRGDRRRGPQRGSVYTYVTCVYLHTCHT